MGLWYETGNGMVKTKMARKSNNCVAFLCCGGPSLQGIDPSLLSGHNRIVFALNNTYPFIKPDVWVGMDGPECYRRDIFWQPFMKIMRGGYQKYLCGDLEVKHLHNMYYVDVAEPEDKEDIFKLRAHDVKFVWKGNVLVTTLHIMIWMGIKKIYLFGCDLDNSKSDYYDKNIKLTDKQKKWNTDLYDEQIEYLKWFNKTGKKYGVELHSCSEGSKINDFINYVNYKHAISALEEGLPETKSLKHVLDTPKNKPL